MVSTETGAQYDDYVVILLEGGVGNFGIEGATDTVDNQITALRDQEQPGRVAHVWGSLTCDVMDFGGCHIEVVRIEAGGELYEFPPVIVP